MAIQATTVQEMYEQMKAKLSDVVPDVELQIKAELAYEINRLKVEKNAVILGHNYMEPALFAFDPGFCGRFAVSQPQGGPNRQGHHRLLWRGVYGRNGQDPQSRQDGFAARRKGRLLIGRQHHRRRCAPFERTIPGVPVVTYINTYADVKAECDICCTSGNAVAVVNSLDSDTIIFLPDEYLAKNVAHETGKRIIIPDQSGNIG